MIGLGAAAVLAQTPKSWWAQCVNDGYRYSYDASIEACTRIISSGKEFGRNLAAAYTERGMVHHHKKAYDRAIADHTKAIEIDPRYANAFHNRCSGYVASNDFARAVTDCSKAIEFDPLHGPSYEQRGHAHLEMKDYHLAIADFNEAIRLDPGDAVAFANRGWAYFNGSCFHQSRTAPCPRERPGQSHCRLQRGDTAW
jgi:tetratricopeptide (TPR) repeat protein